MFTVDGVPQPALAMVHRDVIPFVTSAVERGKFKLYPVLEQAGKELAAKHLWFANLNTPEEFAEAERHLDALDT